MAIQAISSPAAAAETQLAETGWTATASTNSTGGDVPANAIDGNINTRYSSDADQATGMWFQVNLGSAQTF
ncbi:MAG TPA: discoidin domain-containing protein, partial [Streptosporangiaceae bacterium]|nr:discoidin domain-containing protein [Streptosporangiaceae bacterium]